MEPEGTENETKRETSDSTRRAVSGCMEYIHASKGLTAASVTNAGFERYAAQYLSL